jgi:threonine aldolase
MHNPHAYAFASDNTAAATPEALHALIEANQLGRLPSYGSDEQVSQRAERMLAELFETDCKVFFTFTGSASNALSIAALRKPYESVFCTAEAHLEKDEAAAPELFAQGLKLHLVGDARGDKLSIPAMQQVLAGNRGVHSAQPRIISLTQATELGTLYSLSELDALRDFAQSRGLRLHMDGARFANAVAALQVSPAELTWKRGIDILCLGGTKNGIGLSEAVVIFDPVVAAEFGWRRKQGGQLASRMRWLAAPWLGALREGRWLQRAAHANQMARHLAHALQQRGLQLAFENQANGVFVHLPATLAQALERDDWHFYKFFEPDVYRFMCAWDTEQAAIDALLDGMDAALSHEHRSA